ncbi:MAG: hypothetical protein IKE69_07455 [Thermoguttaceae bacterium]|nr:hypothetical protein [Thermoguttaceae bacterium]
MRPKPFNARIAVFGITVVLTLACCATLFSEEIPLDAKTAVELYRASVDQIRTVEADCCDPVVGPDWNAGPNADRDGESNPIHTSYHWYRDLLTEKEYLKGKWPKFTGEKTFDSYEDVTIGFNGDMLYRYSVSDNSGRRVKGKRHRFGSWFNVGVSPLHFLGITRFTSAYYNDLSLLDILEENADRLGFLRLKDGPFLTNDILLSCNYEDGEPKSLTVILDAGHGYLPKFWLTKRLPVHVLDDVMFIERFAETASGIWFPVRMRMEHYYMSYYMEEYPSADGDRFANGMTVEEVNALPKEELEKITSELGYLAVPLGTAVVRVDPDTLKINRPFDESLLSLEKFPDGMTVLDDARNISYTAGQSGDPDLETAPEPNDGTVHKGWSVPQQSVWVCQPEGTESEEEIILSRNVDSNLSIDDIQTSSDDFSVDVSPFNEKGEAVIKIRHTLPPAPSKEKETVTLKISDTREPEIKIGLFYTSFPHIAATPKSLLVYTDGEEPVSREILIESVRETEITAVTAESEGLSFEFGNERSVRHTVRLTVDPARFPAKAYREKATVHIKDAEGNARECVIPIYPVRKHAASEDPDPEDLIFGLGS